MNNDDDIDSETTSNVPSTDASGQPEDRPPHTKEQEAEELRRKIAEIERKVADGN